MRRLNFAVSHEPKSKNSIRESQKIQFQQQILQELRGFKRRAYRSPVVMEIDFYSNQNDPPAIHTLAKNYLDLLEDPVCGSNIKRKKLLYKDDRLIRILIVNYHLEPNVGPHISVKIDTLANYLADLKLVEKIIHNDFREGRSSHKSWLENDFDIRDYECDSDDNPCSELRALQERKESIVQTLGHDLYKVQENWVIQSVQEDFLKHSEIKVSQLLSLFCSDSNTEMPSGHLEELDRLATLNRNWIISPPFTLDLTHTPIQKGDTKKFKQNVDTVLLDFRKRFPVLFPLRTLLGVTVLYIPPKAQSVDLDNLARYIMPRVDEYIEPPSNFINTINIDLIRAPDVKAQFLKMQEQSRRMPKSSVTRYQFIELPRFRDDSHAGCVRLIFDNASSRESLWDKIDDIIRKWE